MSVKACAAAPAAAHTALAALVDKCISEALFSTRICFSPFARVTLAVHGLGFVIDAA